MTASKRTRLSASQRVEVWRRWKAGESLHAIGRALGKDTSGHSPSVEASWWNCPSRPPSFTDPLTLQEREDISRGIACGSSIRDHRQRSDVSRVNDESGGRGMEGDRGPFQSRPV